MLLDDNFASIVNAIEEGRAVYENIRNFLTYVLVHNVAELVPYLGFVLFKIPLALTPIQALAIDIGTDSLTALGSAWTTRPAVDAAPASTPRRETDGLVRWRCVVPILRPIEAAAAMAAFFRACTAGWTYGETFRRTIRSISRPRARARPPSSLSPIVNVFLCRSASRSLFATGFLGTG